MIDSRQLTEAASRFAERFPDRETFRAWGWNGSVLATVSFFEAEAFLKCSVLLVTLLYTARRWWVAEKNLKASKTFENDTLPKL